MNLAGVEGENGAQAGVFLPYSRHALPWKGGSLARAGSAQWAIAYWAAGRVWCAGKCLEEGGGGVKGLPPGPYCCAAVTAEAYAVNRARDALEPNPHHEL